MFQRKAANCLNLVGDGDEIDILVAVERAFSVKILDDEAERCETVGDLFDLVSSKLAPSHAQLASCPTALAFFRLRAALRRLGYTQRMTPQTDLRAIFRAEGARRFQSALSREVGMPLPELTFGGVSSAVLISLMIGTIPAAILAESWLVLFAGVALMIAAYRLLPLEVPRDVAMLGDYAVSCGAWSYGALAKQSGVRLHEFWSALTTVIRESSDTDFVGEMQRETRFFPARKAAS